MGQNSKRITLNLLLIAAVSLAGCGEERAADATPKIEGAGAAALITTEESTAGRDSANAVATNGDVTHLTSKTPYPTPTEAVYSAPPEGYQFFMLQHIARHGSRGLSSADDDDLSLQIWKKAQDMDALTPLGEKLGALVDRVTTVHEHMGYGQLSGLGKNEHREMARRVIARHQQFFTEAAADGLRLSLRHSGKQRAADSGVAFVEGWLALLPEYEVLIDTPIADADTVYFNSGKAALDYDYYLDNDPRLAAVLENIASSPRTREVAVALLERLYSPEFVARLDGGEWTFIAAEDEEDRVNNTVDAALALYGLYVIASNLQDEELLDFTPFIIDEHAAWLAYVDDAESFYERGPGFVGEDITYSGAQILVADMLDKIAATAAGERNYAADLRFSHAEALMPLVTFLGIEGAFQSVTLEQPYSYETNPWRAHWVAPMAANIQWDAFINRDSGEIAIRMLHNEREVRFAPACSPLIQDSFFYALEELSRCLMSRSAISEK